MNAPRTKDDWAEAIKRMQAANEAMEARRSAARAEYDEAKRAKREAVKEAAAKQLADIMSRPETQEALAEAAKAKARAERARAEAEEDRWRAVAQQRYSFPPVPVRDADTYRKRIVESEPYKSIYAALVASCQRGGLSALIGTVGTGKTTLVCAVAKWYIWRHRVRATYKSALTLIGELEHDSGGFNAETDPGTWISRHTMDHGLLVIDELDKFPYWGVETATAAVCRAHLYELIDKRYGFGNRPTILMGNFTKEQWEATVPLALRDRIRRDGSTLLLVGKSLRGEKENVA